MNKLDYYLFENKEGNQRIQWIKNAPIKSAVESEVLKKLIKKATDSFYEPYFTADNKVPSLTKEQPILLYYASNEKDIGDKYLSENGITESDVYNRTDEMAKSMQKKDWHELLGDKDWLPKTLTSTKGIENLNFPIIAKPSEGHSGIGIMKFDTLEECQKELNKKGCKLDVFSEMIKDIDTEYRFIFCKDKLFLVHERIAIESNNKTITTKDPDESLSFLYVEQDLSKNDYNIDKIVKEFRKYIDLDFFALDIMLDKNGKYWVIESNSAIGMGGNTLSRTYQAINEDFYGKEISKKDSEIVEEICKGYYNEIKKDYPSELKQSKNPKTY